MIRPASVGRLLAGLAFVATLLLGACYDRHSEASNPAPSSSMSPAAAHALATVWVDAVPASRGVGVVEPTGSMLPVIDSRSVLLLERVSFDQLRVNDIAVFRAADGRKLVHRIRIIQQGAALFDGDSNSAHDGWVKASAIQWRVAGILYTR